MKDNGELSLNESELRYRRLFESAQDGILILDAETGMIEDVNPYLVALLGYSHEEMVRKKLWEVGSFKDIQASKDAFSALQEDDYIRYENLPLKTKEGLLIQVEFVSNIYMVGKEKVIQCNIRDITDRKKQKLLSDLQNAALNAAANAILITDKEGVIEWVNPAYTLLTGYTADESLGKNPRELVKSGKHDQLFYKQMWETILAGEIWKGEIINRRKDNSLFTEEQTITPIINSNGEISHFIAIKQDISKQIIVNENLREEKEKFINIAATAPGAICSFRQHPDGFANFPYASPAIQDIYGFLPEELVHDASIIRGLIHPDDVQHVRESIALSAQTQSPWQDEYRFRHPIKGEVWIESNFKPKREPDGSILWQGFFFDITERKKADEQITLLKMAMENSGEGVMMTDREGVIMLINPGFTDLYGYGPDEIVGKTTPRILKSGSLTQENYVIFWQTLLNKQVVKGELINKTKDGSLLNVESWSSPIINPHGEIVGFLSLQRDITERKRAESSLRETQSRLEHIIASSPSIIYSLTLDFAPTWVAQNVESLLGYTVVECLVPGWWSDHLHPKDRERVFAEMVGLFEAGNHVHEYQFQLKNGSYHWIHDELRLVCDTQGNPSEIIGAWIDINERKEADEKLRESNRIIEGIINAIPVRVFWKDKDLIYLGCNKGFALDAGYNDPQDVIGKDDYQMVWSGQAELYRQDDRQVIESGKPKFFIEEPSTTPDGITITLLTSKIPLLNSDGEVSGILGTYMDISDRKQREEEIQTRNEELLSLYTLSRLLALADDLEQVIAHVVRHAVESTHVTFACIALLENSTLVRQEFYPVRAMIQERVEDHRQPISSLPFCQRVLKKNEPVILEASDPEISSLERTTLLLDLASSVYLVPLQVGEPLKDLNQVLGVLILGEERDSTRAPFTPEKISLAGSIGNQAASAIRRMLVSEQAGQRLQRIALLREIDSAIAQSFDLRLSLDVILRHVCEQLNVDAVDILVVNHSLQTLEYNTGRGFRTPVIEHRAQRVGEGQAGIAILERRMIQIQHVADNLDIFAHPDVMKAEQFVSYIAKPLIIKGKANGVLEIYQRTPLEPEPEWFDFLNSLAGQAALAIDNDHMYYGLQRSNIELSLAYDATIVGWSHALELRDRETEGHTQRVTKLTIQLAQFFGISDDSLKQMRWGALLHDVGKLGIPDVILHKPGPLTDEEWAVMKSHPRLAYDMLSPIQYLKAALDIPYCHHEKWDGSGYPRGLEGEQIPLVARIFAVIDVWDALTTDRPYRMAWTKEKAIDYFQTSSGTHFDPTVVDVFMKMIATGGIGSG